jgi:hypothetical protein
MNLTAHPYTVLAELQWKQDHLSGAGRAHRHAGRTPGRAGHHTGHEATPEVPTRTWGDRIRHLPHVVRHLRAAAWNH